jgi:hypothetical protein
VQILYPHRRPDVKSSLLPDGCLVIFDEKSELAHTVTPIGAMVWELSDGQHSTADIVATIFELVGGIEAELVAQTEKLIADLHAGGLLE